MTKVKIDCGKTIKIISEQTHCLRMDETKEKGGIPTADEYWHPRSVIIQYSNRDGIWKC